MKFVDEYRNKDKALRLIKGIEKIKDNVKIMEVCGTHTVSIFKYGIRDMIPNDIELLSGPGCPVCVTPASCIERIIKMAMNGNTIASFGDMIKTPGVTSSLQKAKAEGCDIRVVYSPLEAIKIAQEIKNNVIFFGIGFETTSPSIAATIIEAYEKNIKNFFVYPCFKLIPEALEALLLDYKININGFILPGHVSTIIGSMPYEFIPKRYNIPCVITGFEPLDILQAIFILLKQLKDGVSKIEIQYKRAVKKRGNQKAQELMNEVFEKTHSEWRGIGIINNSGLKIREKYKMFDAEALGIPEIEEGEEKSCLCGSVLKGIITPYDCNLFGKICTPDNPIGPCMISYEGTCAAYYKYRWKR